MSNLTSMSGFLLLKFSNVREMQILHFSVFLSLYLATMTGNLLVITAVAFDHHLHTPMYFFLMNLAMLDLGTISVTVPKSMASSLMNSGYISFSECVAQVFFFFLFESANMFLLTVMAHDRYVAICNPLRYEAIMNKRACLQLAACAWITGLLCGVIHAISTFSIPFCSHVVNQFFCEIPALLILTCSDLYLVEIGFLVVNCTLSFGGFIFIITTYVHIFFSVLRNPSKQGKQKAFSTCLPHLTVVSIFVFTGGFAYLKPPVDASSDVHLLISIMYAMVPPMMNPIIYSMRNKQLKVALRKLLRG